ncbi:MAG: hypothetical protein ACETWQ_06725 [Phycisphaerae bacterium]
MRRTNRRATDFIGIVAYLTTIFFLVALVAEFSSGQAIPINDMGGSANPDVSELVNPIPSLTGGVKLGEYAPDFELPKLAIKTDDAGKPVGVISEKDTVRLSSFRGKKPVCLIMSSYT